jgi:hypothetical protein
MTAHRPHPIQDDPPQAVLFDHCDRCDEHVKTFTYSLDLPRLRELWFVRRLWREDLTANERKVIAEIEGAIELAKRLGYERKER